MTFYITKEIQFDAGHRVPNHASKCKNPHGHRFKVVVELCQEELVKSKGNSQEGMVRDFGHVKEVLTQYVHDVYDHGFIVYEQDSDMMQALGMTVSFQGAWESEMGWKVIVVPFIPTAENLAKEIFDNLVTHLGDLLVCVQIWETPTSSASYIPPKPYPSI